MPTRSVTVNLASGRYTVYGEIASGGMATIQYGRLIGAGGFSRAVAIKRLHPQFAKDQNFVSMFLDEARLSARIAHANVVQTLDVLSEPGELSVVMEYVHGESLARLLQRLSGAGERMPVRIAVTLMAGVLHGLHAAHETRGEHGEPLQLVHRDVSPENILVGSDGIPRLLDFGIARAQGRSRVTPAGELKGKLAYMSCEQYRGQDVDRRVDVYGASVVLWEALAGRELFRGETDAAIVGAVMNEVVPAPSEYAPDTPPALDQIVLRGLSRQREQRFESAREMALALEREIGVGTQSEVADWLDRVAGAQLAERAEQLRRMRMRADAETNDPSEPVTRRLEAGATPAGTSTPADRSSRAPRTRTRIRGLTEMSSQPRRMLASLLLIALGAASAALVWWARREPPPSTRDTGSPEATSAPEQGDPAPAVGATTPTRVGPDASDSASPAQTPGAGPRTSTPVAEPPRQKASTQSAPAKAPSSTATRPRPRRAEKAAETSSRGDGPKAKPALDCSQPFWIDERGIRHVRRECLND